MAGMQEITHRAHVFKKNRGGGACLRTPLAGRAHLWHTREHASCEPGQNHKPVLILLSKPTDFLNQNVGKYGYTCSRLGPTPGLC